MTNTLFQDDVNPVDAAIAEYFDAVDAGQSIAPAEFIARHEDLREELGEFFAAADEIESLAGPTLLEYSRQISGVDTSSILDTHSRPAARQGRQRRELAAGSRFGRYQVVEEIGRGAMGSVYLAFDQQLARNVALKIPVFDQHHEPDMIQRFYREARVAATIRNPHICPVFDVDQIDGVHYITMAFIEGETLSHYIQSHRELTPHVIAGIVLKIASALQKMHDNGVIHRDLKPGNIMIDRDGEPVVMDFGLARDAKPGEIRATHAGAIIGSPAYMSPEQILGDDALIGPASDVYSLGIIMHEMLTGELPYRGSILSVFSQVVSDEPTPRAALAKSVDRRLASICESLIAKSLDQRLPSMSSVAAALEEYLYSVPPVIAPNPFASHDVGPIGEKPAVPPTEKLAATPLVAVVAGMLLLMLVLAGAGASVGYWSLAKPKKAVTAQPVNPPQTATPQQAAIRPQALDPQQATQNDALLVAAKKRPKTQSKQAGNAPKRAAQEEAGNAAAAFPRTVSLRYNFPAETKFGYAIKIEAAREKLKETLEGTLFYEVIETEKGNSRIRFDSRLTARNNSQYPGSILTYERVSGSFPTFRDIVGQFPRHEFVVNRYGEIVEDGCQTQLPFALGCLGHLPIEAFGDRPVGGQRTLDAAVEVYQTPPPARIHPLYREPEMTPLKFRTHMGIRVEDPKANDVVLDTTYQTDAADQARYSAKGDGKIVFAKKRGLVTRKNLSLNATDSGRAVKLTVTCVLLDDDELADRWEKLRPEPNPLTPEHQARIETLTNPLDIPPALAITDKTALKENDTLQAPRGGKWLDVKVLEVLSDGRVRIHWIGFGPEYDEVITRNRLRQRPVE